MNDVFITDNFLLQNDAAVRLYHEFARDLPIIDYHCHLPPAQIARDQRFENLAQIWLHGDHYKWRAMRSNGVPERYCTGDASDWEKFEKWAQTVADMVRSPLYHWTHLELKRPFGISDRLLSPQTAKGVWDECNAMLAMEAFSCRGIMRQMNVALVCTTDDPTDNLEHHAAIAADPSMSIQVLPTFRPDKAMAVDAPQPFNAWVERLAEASGVDVGDDYGRFLEALRKRHQAFEAIGCCLSDHGLETVYAADYTETEILAIFARIRGGRAIPPDQIDKFKSAVLYELALMDHESGWTQQYHLKAMRDNNTRQFRAMGPDSGYDSMGDWQIARALAKFLDRLDRDDRLAQTILYSVNAADNDVMATMLGNFQDGNVPGKMQLGSGWWFLDQKLGMEAQMNSLSNMGLLNRFVGMLTDSRSFLSYTRHEYFRRILCNLLGTEMEQGLLPRDVEQIGALVQDICCRNAKRYFGFKLDGR